MRARSSNQILANSFNERGVGLDYAHHIIIRPPPSGFLDLPTVLTAIETKWRDQVEVVPPSVDLHHCTALCRFNLFHKSIYTHYCPHILTALTVRVTTTMMKARTFKVLLKQQRSIQKKIYSSFDNTTPLKNIAFTIRFEFISIMINMKIKKISQKLVTLAN